MADTAVTITQGTGTNIDTRTEATNGNHRQVVVLGDPSVNAGIAPVDATLGLTVNATALTSIDTKTPALGQALAAASIPVVLPSATITTLTPPAALTGFSTSALQTTGNSSLTTLAGAVSATHMQVDVLTMPTVTVNAHAVTNAGTFVVQENGAALTALQVIDNMISGSEAQVDIVAALPAGTNAIGKLAANSGVDIGDVDVTSIAAGTNLVGDVDIAPRTTGGWLVGNFTSGDTYTALTATAQVIKASAGKFGGYYIFNPNAAATYVMIYNIAAASVTVGTSTALLVFCIPASSAANLELLAGIPFSNAGWSIAAATTGGGNTAPTTALECMVFYK